MQLKSSQTVYAVTVVFASGDTRTITVKASSREVAERRALKRIAAAVSVKRDES